MSDPERVLFVHAHPDDETIDTGGTIATLIDRGAWVTVLTCTRGERGEVLPADLRGALETPDTLASLRTSELVRAMQILGVTDHRYLGDETAHAIGRAARPYRDSGMQWGAAGAEPTSEVDPGSLVGADFRDVAADIAAVILDVRPDVVVSYDAHGGYGHPDHLRVRDAALRAAQVHGVPYYAIDANGELNVDISAVLDRKRAALAAYRSQLTLDGAGMVYPGGQRQPVTTVERYSHVEDPTDGPIPFSEQHPAARFVAAVVGGVIGVGLGALLTVYNQFTVRIAGEDIWVGAIAAALIVAAVLAGLRLAFGTRIVPAFAAAGVVAIVGLFSLPSRGGTQLIQQTGPGLLWEIAPIVLGVVVIAWPQAVRRRPGKIEKQNRNSSVS
jgi:N-acetyl-1-D-myo-inositol-2-amino-2-deoxy-alpha-D-glucopyranoside deacetylase